MESVDLVQNTTVATTTTTINQYGQEIGVGLPDWKPAQSPQRIVLDGQYCRLEPLIADQHAVELYEAFQAGTNPDKTWTYMANGPFNTYESYYDIVKTVFEVTKDPMHFAVIDKQTNKAVGTIAFIRIDPKNGSIEVGSVVFSALLKRTRQSSEAVFLLMKYAFDQLGYRRFEWKCDSLNELSRKAADRYGFTFEGTFRQAIVYKGRNRDTNWYSILDSEYNARIRAAFVQWLDPNNFGADGQQVCRLSDLTKAQLL
ncbi:hypothetical protein SAMD00019534_079670 [Acytostelium subglobosum LB1]|uniref:hypothetical protein n=1 Tax=Acytostelium subglobosum LB1 TaxID=1410327 RepID=UPI0006449834|nr:hypothetical protein SAMD00019534_079670 [Acytostelium subglobosum LB1]GAM24792.1 hypothetical protein SAMD00019534_079670 [Acytostelium subglobosum LB1]|eukprot:XP_012752461.1 hypothetical protein SAMD00019534_079670 [Acytostelium subglobosum LB1]